MSNDPEFDGQLQTNRRFYEAHANEIRQQYAGQYVGIAFGRVVAANPDFFEVCRVLDALIPRPKHQAAFYAQDEPAFEPIDCSYRGEFLPWDESYAIAPRTAGTLSTFPSVPDTKS